MKYCLLMISMLFMAGFVSAQESPSQPDQLFSSDLIAWSEMQQPQAPEQQPGQKAPAAESAQPAQNSAAAENQNQAPTESEFAGIVTEDEGGFVLKISETANCKLDNQKMVEQYEGQRVRVTGNLDAQLNVIHVDRIEPIS